MRPLIVVWPIGLAFWAVFLWSFFPEWRIIRAARRLTPEERVRDRGSIRVIELGMRLGSLGAFIAAFYLPAAAIRTHRVAVYWLGVALLLAGTLLRRHCWRMLGRSFTGAVVVRPGQQVVERGAYRLVRHPSYTAGVIMFVGIGLTLGNWLSVAVMAIVPILVYLYRVRVEEQALVDGIGEPYRDYMRRVRRRFVPYVV